MKNNKPVADLLFEIRSSLGMNMSEFARKADVDIAHYSRIEKGECKPGLDTLEKLCKTHSIDPRVLIPYREGQNNGSKKKGEKRKK